MAAGMLPSMTPAAPEEVDKFISENNRWLDDTAAAELKRLSSDDQRRVIAGGSILNCRDAVGVIRARVRQSKEKEALLSGELPSSVPVVPGGGGHVLHPSANKDEVEVFIRANLRWLSGEAEDIFRAMNPIDQKRVISAGTMSGCRDPVAVLQTRAKRAREMEHEFEQLTRGRQGQVGAPEIPVPQVAAEVSIAYVLAKPEEVKQGESRFAQTSTAPPKEPEPTSTGPLAGDVRGVGGVVEILKPKYGCTRGQRLRVLGETATLLQLDGGKTAPKNHEGSGYRWVMRADEAKQVADKQAEKAKQQARQLEMEQALKARQERLAKEAEQKEQKKARKTVEKESKDPKGERAEEKAADDEDKHKEQKCKSESSDKKKVSDAPKGKKQSHDDKAETRAKGKAREKSTDRGKSKNSKEEKVQSSKRKGRSQSKGKRRRRGSSDASSAPRSDSAGRKARRSSTAAAHKGKKAAGQKRKERDSSSASDGSTRSKRTKSSKKNK